MSAIAVERPGERRAQTVLRATGRVALFFVVLAALWALWEGYRALWIHEGWTRPFVVDSSTMPHVHDIFRALWRHSSSGTGGRLITQLLKAAAFTAKEAAVGFALGASVGFVLGVLLSQSRILQRVLQVEQRAHVLARIGRVYQYGAALEQVAVPLKDHVDRGVE